MINNYDIQVTLNGMNSLLNFMKIYQLVQDMSVGAHRRTDRLVIS
jgi:hypothetical protein